MDSQVPGSRFQVPGSIPVLSCFFFFLFGRFARSLFPFLQKLIRAREYYPKEPGLFGQLITWEREDPIEVAEVEIAVLGSCQSGQGPGEKKFNQKFWNLQFLSYKNVIHLKQKLRTIVFQDLQKKIWYHLKEGLDKKLMKFECWFPPPTPRFF